MNCPLCGKDAVSLFSSVECGTLRCPNFDKKQYKTKHNLVYWQMEDCISTPEEIKKGIFKVNIQIPKPPEFIKLDFL